MIRLAYAAAAFIAAALALVASAPFLLCLGLSRVWDAVELRAVYGGDEAARDKDRWRSL